MNYNRLYLCLCFTLLLVCVQLGSSNDIDIERDIVQSVVDEDTTNIVANDSIDDVLIEMESIPVDEPQSNKIAPESTAERPSTLSIPKTNLKPTLKSGDAKHLNDAASKAKPAANAGSYYGSNDGHSDRFANNASPQVKRSGEKSSKLKVRMDKHPLSGAQDLEDRLNFELRQSRKVEDRTVAENAVRARRFKIARKFAYPVEHLLEVYHDPNTDLYDVLGVKHTILEEDLRKVYRDRAKEVHPDKNPHPDAKRAFDALQEAYNLLSHADQRAEYDQQRRRTVALARARRFNLRRIRKFVTDQIENWTSSLKLFHHELLFTETSSGLQRNSVGKTLQLLWQRVCNAVRSKLIEMKIAVHQEIEHYVLLPSHADRLQLLHEQLWRHKYHVLVLLLLVGLTRR